MRAPAAGRAGGRAAWLTAALTTGLLTAGAFGAAAVPAAAAPPVTAAPAPTADPDRPVVIEIGQLPRTVTDDSASATSHDTSGMFSRAVMPWP